MRSLPAVLCFCVLFCLPHGALSSHMSSPTEEKGNVAAQRSICLPQLSNLEQHDDAWTGQSRLRSPVYLITGVIHTKSKCLCLSMCVCVCVCVFAFSACLCFELQTTNKHEVWVLLSHWCNYTHTHTHAHNFHPVTSNHTHSPNEFQGSRGGVS